MTTVMMMTMMMMMMEMTMTMVKMMTIMTMTMTTTMMKIMTRTTRTMTKTSNNQLMRLLLVDTFYPTRPENEPARPEKTARPENYSFRDGHFSTSTFFFQEWLSISCAFLTKLCLTALTHKTVQARFAWTPRLLTLCRAWR
jgi:hypothetical protein